MTTARFASLSATALFLSLAARTHAVCLTNSQDLGTGVLRGTNALGVVESIRSNAVTPNLFWWADTNGDNTANDPASAGLSLGTNSLTRGGSDNATGFILNLNDGTSDGAITWNGGAGGQISTKRATKVDASGGPITIIGVTSIACSNIDTSAWAGQAGSGGNITITQSADLVVGNLFAQPASGTGTRSPGVITLTGAGRDSGTPAGLLVVGNAIVDAYSGSLPGRVYIKGYDTVSIGAGGIATYKTLDTSSLPSITITNIGGGGITVAGTIDNSDPGSCSSATALANSVMLASAGSVQVAEIRAFAGSGLNWIKHPAGTITILAGGSVGSRGTLSTYMLGAGEGNSDNSGAVNITAGGNVLLGGLDTHNIQPYATRAAGNVQVTAGGNITIGGTIDVSSAYGVTKSGNLVLSASGTNTVSGLDLNLVKSVTLSAGTGTNVLTGPLKNFPITNSLSSTLSATNGTAGGGTIYYDPQRAANLYLKGATYALGAGKGTLTPGTPTAGAAVNWTGAANTNFEDGANWTGSEAPSNDVATSIASIGTPGGSNPSLTRSRAVSGVSFSNTGWVLAGGTNVLTVGRDGLASTGAGVNAVGSRLSLDPAIGAFAVGAGNELQVTGMISGSGPLAKVGAGTLTLANSNTLVDTTWVFNGTLNVAHGAGLGTSTLTVTNGTVNLLAITTTVTRLDDNGLTTGGTVVLGRQDPGGNDGTLVVGDSRNGTFSTVIADASGKIGSLVKVGTGRLTLAGLNTYSGSTLVNAGTLAYGINNALGSGSVTVNGATLDVATYADTVGTVTLNGGTLTGSSGILSSTGTFEMYSGTLSAKLGGASAVLNKTTAGTLAISSASTYAGGTTIQGGVVQLKGASPFGTGPLSLQGGTMYAESDNTLNNDVSLDGDFSFSYTAGSAYPGDIFFSKQFVLNGNYTLTHLGNSGGSYPQPVSFSAGVGDGGHGYALTIKYGTYNNDMFVLGTGSTYTGPTVIHGSTLELVGTLASTTEIRANRGGTFLIFWNSSGTDNRLDNSVPITLRNGQLSADAYQSSGVNQWGSSETVGTVTLDYGHSTIRAGGGRPRVALTITNLARNAGSTVYFYRAGNSSKTADFYGYGQVKLTAWQPGFMGGWAVARRTDYNPSGTLYESGYDFGYYSNSTAILSGVLPMENQEPRPGQVAGASASDHVKVLAAQTTLSGNTAINSLCVTNNGCNNDLGGFQLNIASGGLLNSATSYAITNGTLTSSGGNLYLYNLGTAMTNGAAITGGGVSVSTVGNMLLAGNNSFGGNLYVNAGILTLSGVNGGVSEAIVTPGSFLILQNAGALSAMTKVNLLYDGEEYARVTNSFANVRIKGLTLNGVKQPFGTYGATGSGCRYTNDFYFGGTGTWSVVAPSGTMVLFR